MTIFSADVLNWFAKDGRKDLPWQKQISPYRVWVSEIMLQQTQVATVIPYFDRFLKAFPDVYSLAEADIDLVLHHWTGLGYYARARNLSKAAQIIVHEYDGEFPQSVEQLCDLPGIGRSTAGAIVALAHQQHATILDGNVKRVLTRYHAIGGWPEQSQVNKQLWQLAESLTPQAGCAEYTQAIMDLGSLICTRSKPACQKCPLAGSCKAFLTGTLDQYPGRKPKKTLPVKEVAMLMLQNEDNEVLLEKRPPSGIWGSLWSFPESESSPFDVTTVIDNGLMTQSTEKWPVIRHTFSHYHLDITPIHEVVSTQKNLIMDSSRWLWYPLQQPSQVGLAKPVKTLLEKLADQSKPSD